MPSPDISKILVTLSEQGDAMKKHFVDDEVAFSRLTNNVEKNHDIHIRNEETLKNILQQTTKTNGRVTRLEDLIYKYDTVIALLSQSVTELKESNVKLYNISSKQDGLLLAQWKNIEEKFSSKDQTEPVKKIVYGLVAIILTSFVGALFALVIK